MARMESPATIAIPLGLQDDPHFIKYIKAVRAGLPETLRIHAKRLATRAACDIWRHFLAHYPNNLLPVLSEGTEGIGAHLELIVGWAELEGTPRVFANAFLKHLCESLDDGIALRFGGCR